MKDNFVTVLDFGSGKITCMAASKVSEKGDFIIKAVGQVSYNGFDDSVWYEPETIAGAVKDAISQVSAKMSTPIKQIVVGVPGVFSVTETSEASLTFHSKKKIDFDDTQDIIHKADIIAGGSELIPLGGKPVYYILDGAIKTTNPVGAIANKLTGLVSFSFMRNYFYKTVSPVLSQMGIKDVKYVATCDAQSHWIASTMGVANTALVIDVGHITSNVMLTSGNSLLFARTFALGSGYLASDICSVLGCDFNFAMALLGKINLNLEFQEGDSYTVNGRMMDATKTNDVVSARIEQIAEYIIKSFRYCDKEIPATTPVILTGGGLTYLRGGADKLSTFLGKPIVTYDSANPQTRRNEYTSCYGLLHEAVMLPKRKKSIFSIFRKN
ncbi:MAG: hypothetical protein IKC52_04080 [Clostridia bacterium]|nr:hypothetical protein [Clostridia bacterium]